MTALATSQGTPQIQVNPTELSDHQKHPLQIYWVFLIQKHTQMVALLKEQHLFNVTICYIKGMVRKISKSISISSRLPWKIGRYGAPKKSGRALVAGRALVESRSHGISENVQIEDIHMSTSQCEQCHNLVPSKRARLVQHGQEMVTLAGTRLSICTKPQQTAEINASYCMR